MKTDEMRDQILKQVRHNPLLIPEELVLRDYSTDSLLGKSIPETDQAYSKQAKPTALELQEIFKDIFGFPFVIPVSQGRLAEAIMFRAMVRNGHYIPCSALFPTTHAHQSINGATSMEVLGNAAYNASNSSPFKGNIDTQKLEHVIKIYHPRWVPFICIEPCNNATGGHPISMDNMRRVSEIAKKFKIPILLDACRMIENCVLIQRRESAFKKTSVFAILKEFCSYADGLTMSAMKDFPTSIGGFLATRSETLYHTTIDFVFGFGSGLSHKNTQQLLNGIKDTAAVLTRVETRMQFVEALHAGIANSYPLVQPVGGHAVYIDLARLKLNVPKDQFPFKSFLYHLYREYGIRAAENPQSPEQMKRNLHLIRFAVPIIGETDQSIRETISDLVAYAKVRDNIGGLKKISQPPGLTGPFRASYEPIKEAKS